MILVIIKGKDKEFGSGFQFTSCERVAEMCKIKRTKILYQRMGVIAYWMVCRIITKVELVSYIYEVSINVFSLNLH